MAYSTSIFSHPLLLILSFLSSSSSTSFDQSQINVWPLPAKLRWRTSAFAPFSSSFEILNPIPSHRPLSYAVRRYSNLLKAERHRPLAPPAAVAIATTPPVVNLSISISNPSVDLVHGVDESYTLTIPLDGGSANLSAATAWGVMRGLETLSQLVFAGGGGGQIFLPAGVEIADAPLFPHRGVLLDTARNFYSVKDILRTIRAMSYNKLNVFHWHITDSQSFPLLLQSEPELAIKGSYGGEMRYTAADVRLVVAYALRHGVRVIPEVDTPGHTASWAGAYPEIVTCANKFWAPQGGPALAAEPGAGQLNPLNPKTYKVVTNVLREVAELFPDTFYHAGADEVNKACWEDDIAIQSFLSKNGSLNELLERFVNTTYSYIVSLNKTAVYWEDVVLSSGVNVTMSMLPKENTIMQTWNNGPVNTKRLTSAGYRVIVSSADFYYLDCGHGGWIGNDSRYDVQTPELEQVPFNYGGGNGGSWCNPFKSWQRVYDYDITHGLNEEEKKLVLGGEVALWSEQADGAVVDERLWPRAAAMAEAMWSGNRDAGGRKRYAAATDRLNEWRHRMVRRGIRAEPIQPLWCVRNPGMCNLIQ